MIQANNLADIMIIELRSHPVIIKVGLDMDDASNGFFLRVPDEDISATSRHRGYHSVYSNFVRKKLDEIDVNLDISIIEKQVFELQQKLRLLQENGLPLYMKEDYLENELKRIKEIGMEQYKIERKRDYNPCMEKRRRSNNRPLGKVVS